MDWVMMLVLRVLEVIGAAALAVPVYRKVRGRLTTKRWQPGFWAADTASKKD